MKKSLIALAALASIGSAFAQSTVTLSGKFATAYQQAPGAQAGLAVTDGDARFTAVEDLGGGLKATAAMELRIRGRGDVNGRDATVGLAGGFGSVTLGAVEAGNGIIGRGFAGAPVSLPDGFDGSVLSGPSNVDWLRYTSPAFITGLTANYQRVDSIGTPGGGKGTLQANVIGVDYAAGAISAGADFTKFSNSTERTRVSASYDLGMAKLGFGFEKPTSGENQIALGVSAPFGAVTAGLIYAKTGDEKGFGLGANYALSKRTVLNASFGKVDAVTNGTAIDDKQYRFRVMHSF